jgi:hypothetical protein
VTLYQPTEAVVVCDACGFAALVGPRCRDWVAYKMAVTEERWVWFGFCTGCGVSFVRPFDGGPLSRQPSPLSLRADSVQVAPWEMVPSGPDAGVCPACGEAAGLLWLMPDPPTALNAVWCPICWGGPMRLTDVRASHPGW